MTKTSRLIEVREANAHEQRTHKAEVVFVRQHERGNRYTIFGTKSHDSWEQWGAPDDVLSDNVDAIERWRRNGGIEGVLG